MVPFVTVFLQAVGMLVLVWVAVFGGLGALHARSLGVSEVFGLAVGVALGPIGWLVTWLRYRRAGFVGRRAAGPMDQHLTSGAAVVTFEIEEEPAGGHVL